MGTPGSGKVAKMLLFTRHGDAKKSIETMPCMGLAVAVRCRDLPAERYPILRQQKGPCMLVANVSALCQGMRR